MLCSIWLVCLLVGSKCDLLVAGGSNSSLRWANLLAARAPAKSGGKCAGASECSCSAWTHHSPDDKVPLDEEALLRDDGIFNLDWEEKHGDYPAADAASTSACQLDGMSLKLPLLQLRPVIRVTRRRYLRSVTHIVQ